MLAELDLRECGLMAVPSALSGVQHTLRRLNLCENVQLQIYQAGIDTLLALPVLEWVDVQKKWFFVWSTERCFLAKVHFFWSGRSCGQDPQTAGAQDLIVVKICAWFLRAANGLDRCESA